jgi:membrane protein implicated in regulation of membrane protease activity
MKDALRVAGVVTLVAFLLAPGAALAGTAVAPELDPSFSVAGLALLGGTAAFVIERYRRRAK